MKLILIIGILFLSISAQAQNLDYGDYNCNYNRDTDRGLNIVRARLSITKGEAGKAQACLSFFNYTNGQQTVRGISCGKYNSFYGVRRSGYGIPSVRFDGYEDYIRNSSESIPPAKRRFGIFEFDGSFFRFSVMGDRRISPDAVFNCKTIR